MIGPLLFAVALLYAVLQIVGAVKLHRRTRVTRADRDRRWQALRDVQAGRIDLSRLKRGA